MGSVAADSVDGHEDAQDDAEGAENEKSDGEADLLVGRAVVDGVRIVHHDILVGYREGCRSGIGFSEEMKFGNLKEFLYLELPKEHERRKVKSQKS
ncbi:hypothetical protein GQ457_16G005530 [Hibiscus cannabinus]